MSGVGSTEPPGSGGSGFGSPGSGTDAAGAGGWPGEPRGVADDDVHDEEQQPESRVSDPALLDPAANGEVPELASESVLAPAQEEPEQADEVEAEPVRENETEPELEALPETEPGPELEALPEIEPMAEPEPVLEEAPALAVEPVGHAPGELAIPDDVGLLEGTSDGIGRSVGVVVSRFNGEVTRKLLESALEELDRSGVARDRITVMPVPGAFELPLGAMALAKTRRFACIVALGCVIRGETSHFEYVAGEAASGLQLAGLETGVPVSFGVLTVDTLEQAEARIDKGADAARAALEMADLFSQVRKQAGAG